MTAIDTLPIELVSRIQRLLDFEDLLCFAMVNQRCYHLYRRLPRPVLDVSTIKILTDHKEFHVVIECSDKSKNLLAKRELLKSESTDEQRLFRLRAFLSMLRPSTHFSFRYCTFMQSTLNLLRYCNFANVRRLNFDDCRNYSPEGLPRFLRLFAGCEGLHIEKLFVADTRDAMAPTDLAVESLPPLKDFIVEGNYFPEYFRELTDRTLERWSERPPVNIRIMQFTNLTFAGVARFLRTAFSTGIPNFYNLGYMLVKDAEAVLRNEIRFVDTKMGREEYRRVRDTFANGFLAALEKPQPYRPSLTYDLHFYADGNPVAYLELIDACCPTFVMTKRCEHSESAEYEITSSTIAGHS